MKRLGCADRLEAYFKARPNVWIDGLELGRIGCGAYGWRSRLTPLRRQCGMVIENRQRYVYSHEDGCPAVQAWDTWDIEHACNCGRSKRRTVSEYRYVPAVPQVDAAHDTNTWSLR